MSNDRKIADQSVPGDIENHRETGGRIYPPHRRPDPFAAIDQKAAENRKPPRGIGLTEELDETPAKTRKSDGRDQPV
jgi:hypothetical protein